MNKCIRSSKIYTPQTYIEMMTHKCYLFDCDNVYEEIEKILEQNFGEGVYWSYEFKEIDHIVENKIPVVLVDVSGFYGTMKIQPMYRWLQVPDQFVED